MTITINEDICRKYGLELEELLAILLVKSSADIPKLFKSLEDKEILIKDVFNGYMVTQRWNDVSDTVLLDSDKETTPESRIQNLAIKLMAEFPACKKQGTCHYFRGNSKDNTLKLKKFFKLYGNKYTDEQIVNAARRYVKSFNGNYSYMRILKYFIWKDEKKTDENGKGYIEETSDLASWIENEGQIESNNEWTAELR